MMKAKNFDELSSQGERLERGEPICRLTELGLDPGLDQGLEQKFLDQKLIDQNTAQAGDDPSDDKILEWLGRLAMENQEWEVAEMAHSSLLERRVKPADLVGLAEALLNQFRLGEAEERLLEALNQISEPCQLLFSVYKRLGQLNVVNKNFPMAEECYNKAYTLNPQSSSLQFHKALLNFKQENYRDAAKGFQALLERQPKMAKAWLGLALSRKALAEEGLSKGERGAGGLSTIENLGQKDFCQANLNQESLNQANLDQESVNQANLDQENVNQTNLDQESLNQENLDQANLNQESLILENLARACLDRCLDLDPKNKKALEMKEKWNPLREMLSVYSLSSPLDFAA